MIKCERVSCSILNRKQHQLAAQAIMFTSRILAVHCVIIVSWFINDKTTKTKAKSDTNNVFAFALGPAPVCSPFMSFWALIKAFSMVASFVTCKWFSCEIRRKINFFIFNRSQLTMVELSIKCRSEPNLMRNERNFFFLRFDNWYRHRHHSRCWIKVKF